MAETEWNIAEIKRVKTKLLVEVNIVMLLLFVLALLYIRTEWPLSVLLVLMSVLLWAFTVHALYIIITGRTTGTKTNRLSQAFDRDRWGEKRWKRKKVTEAVIIGITSIGWTVLVFTVDTGSDTLQFHHLWPFIGAWIGTNLGNIARISTIE